MSQEAKKDLMLSIRKDVVDTFDFVVENDLLYVSSTIYNYCNDNNIHSGDSFIKFLKTFPSAFGLDFDCGTEAAGAFAIVINEETEK